MPSPWFTALFGQDLLQKIQRSRVFALSQPEDCLLAHDWVLVGRRQADQPGHCVLIVHLAQGEDRLLLYLGFRIIFNGLRNLLPDFPAALLRQPEDCLAAHVWALIVA